MFNKKKKSRGEITSTYQAVPKSWDDMTAEEKWDWAGELLGSIKPKDSKQS